MKVDPNRYPFPMPERFPYDLLFDDGRIKMMNDKHTRAVEKRLLDWDKPLPTFIRWVKFIFRRQNP